MSAHEILTCAACGAPRVDMMSERTDRNGHTHFRMNSTRTVCPRCAEAVETLMRRLGEVA